ncbi:bacteriohemerythrin [Magnetococcus sp. PR-3]|uniref:bacteriohemerythrin n=1 Tax=Magnetococcus sp. PR-3 TaxID=3120355 RepID=UPI002FCE5A8D
MVMTVWKPEYALGIATIDEQHQGLFAAFEGLQQSIVWIKDGHALGAMLDMLLNQVSGYVRTHLRYEEQLFERYGYPETEQHKKQHEVFEVRLNQYQEALRLAENAAQKSQVTHEVSAFLEQWLVEHIQQQDRQYADFLKNKGVC